MTAAAAYAEDCVFCAIRAGRGPATVVLDAPEALVVMDVAPSAPGQLVLVPDGGEQGVAEAARLLPRCVRALEAAGFAERAVHAVVRWDLEHPDHPHPVITVVPGPHGLRPNPLGGYVTRARLEEDARLIVRAFGADGGPVSPPG
ncbi:HIT family protein [Kitasatospora sp. NPDC004289]